MKTSTRKQISKVVLMFAALLFVTTPTSAATYAFEGSQAVNSDHLATMRGGFITGNGLRISLGIEKATIIDGVMKIINTLNIPNLANLKVLDSQTSPLGDLPASNAQTPVTVPINNPVDVTTASSVETPVTVPINNPVGVMPVSNTETPVTVPINNPVDVTTASNAQTSVTVPINNPVEVTTASNAQTPVTVPINNPVEVTAADLQPESSTLILNSGFNTVIQNSLNQKTIQNVTIINATVDNVSLFRQMQLMSRINERLINTLR